MVKNIINISYNKLVYNINDSQIEFDLPFGGRAKERAVVSKIMNIMFCFEIN